MDLTTDETLLLDESNYQDSYIQEFQRANDYLVRLGIVEYFELLFAGYLVNSLFKRGIVTDNLNMVFSICIVITTKFFSDYYIRYSDLVHYFTFHSEYTMINGVKRHLDLENYEFDVFAILDLDVMHEIFLNDETMKKIIKEYYGTKNGKEKKK